MKNPAHKNAFAFCERRDNSQDTLCVNRKVSFAGSSRSVSYRSLGIGFKIVGALRRNRVPGGVISYSLFPVNQEEF